MRLRSPFLWSRPQVRRQNRAPAKARSLSWTGAAGALQALCHLACRPAGPRASTRCSPALAGPLAHPPSGPLWGAQTATPPKGIPVQPQDLLSCCRVPTLAPGSTSAPSCTWFPLLRACTASPSSATFAQRLSARPGLRPEPPTEAAASKPFPAGPRALRAAAGVPRAPSPPPPTPAPGPPCLPLPGLARLPLPRTCCAKHRRPQASSYIRVVPTHPRQPICAFFLSVDTTQQSAARRRLDPAVRKSAPVLVHGDLHTSLPTCSSLQRCCTGPTPPVKSEGAEPRQAAPAPPQPPRPRLRAGCYGSDAPFRSSVWKLGEALQKEAGSYPVTRQRRGFHTCWSQKASAEREGASSSHHRGLSNLPSCVSTAGPSGPRT